MEQHTQGRVIKFRAWGGSTEKKYFVYFDLAGGTFDDRFEESEPDYTGGCLCHDKEDVIAVQQFTGLTDKNGKEIYEGDVLKANTDEKPVVVEWLKDRNGWSFNQEFVNGGAPDQQGEVIGNIYENPELLGEYPAAFKSEAEQETGEQ